MEALCSLLSSKKAIDVLILVAIIDIPTWWSEGFQHLALLASQDDGWKSWGCPLFWKAELVNLLQHCTCIAGQKRLVVYFKVGELQVGAAFSKF